MDEHSRMQSIRQRKDLENDKKYKEESRERLKKICITKIRTTMIGAIDSVERRFEQFYDKNSKLTNEQLVLQKMFEDIRTEILDKGNQQIRNLENEFEQYSVEWKRYSIQLPVKPYGN